MLSTNVRKYIQSLGLKKNREEKGEFIAEGPKIVEELLRVAPENIVSVYAVADWLRNSGASANTIEISEIDLEKISQLKTPHQVLAVVRQFSTSVPDTSKFILYLDAIQDPGNFGTIIRIADWFGIKDVVCGPDCADVYNPKAVQSTMASIARVNIVYDENKNWLKQQKTIFAASLHGKPLKDFSPIKTGTLVIGNESKGIRSEYLQLATEQITIQKRGEAESLNAAVATGIILSHLLP